MLKELRSLFGSSGRVLSNKEALILHLLIEAGQRGMYGLELVETSNGDLKRGTVYVTLSRMEAKGLVTSAEEQRQIGVNGPPLRKYTPTALGCREYDAWLVSRQLVAAARRR